MSAEQIKAAQEHLYGHGRTEVPKDNQNTHKENEVKHEHHGEEHDHGFAAERVIREDEQGFVVSHGDHTNSFFKKFLTKKQLKKAQEHFLVHV